MRQVLRGLLPVLLTGMINFAYGNANITQQVVTLTTGVAITVSTVEPVAYLNQIVESLPPQNAAIVRTLLSYPRDGTHQYWWPKGDEAGVYDGATTNVTIGPTTALRGEVKGRTFCCGLTLEVFYRTLEQEHMTDELRNGLSEFKKNWFCKMIYSPGPEDALTTFKLGTKIGDPAKALPGDFVQIWRNNKSGHSVIFVNWVLDDQKKVVGLQYWSTQPKTGIAFNTEYFGGRPQQMDISKISIARVNGKP